jgi:hypothetical protein
MKYEIVNIGNSDWIVTKDGVEVYRGSFADCGRYVKNEKQYG